MSHPRFSLHTVVLALALAALLAAGLTLVVVAQDPDDPDTAIASDPEVCDVSISPDKVTAVEEIELLPDPSSPSASGYYKFLAASTFVPLSDDMTFQYFSGGCIYRTGGGKNTVHSLELPHGAEIDYLRIYFFDDDPTNDASAYLYAYNGTGALTQIASVKSSGTPGLSSALSDLFSHSVNNVEKALVLLLHYDNGVNSDLRICGVRIRYQYTPSIVDLPLILNGDGP